MNTYNQFDVQKNGAILNNASRIANTQQAGYINGNPNFGPNDAARVIVNQVNSRSASQINGYVEVAGPRAEVVIANGSGISVNGGGFINTSRAILTTGTPNFAADGSLAGFNVTGGNITVTGVGFNGTNVDQVDLIARAVQANAAIYAKNLNVITGANKIDHDTLNATPIVGDGAAPEVSIDVSNLGGMYANRIVLVGTENGVGVSNKGVLAAQAGDLILTTQGKLELAGQTNASGNIAINARDGIDDSGTTYAQQNLGLNTSGALTNGGVIAAQQNTSINAGSVASTGTLGAGVNGDGTLASNGDLNINASGEVTATGRNAAGGNASLSGSALNLTGSRTSASTALTLNAGAGDLNLTGATTTAGGTLNASAAGTLTNDNGALSSGSAQTITVGALSNRHGQIVSASTLATIVAGAISNQGGTVQAAGAQALQAASIDNTGGHIASLDADGLTLTIAGLLNNGASGTIGGNGNVRVLAGQIANAGSITAVQSLIATAVQSLFSSGMLAANGDATLSAGTTLTNGGTITAGRALTLSAATFDNSHGSAQADQFTLHATNLVNRGGSITQTGTGATSVDVTGTLDNTSGTLQTNAGSLALGPATLVNDNGTIANSGNGTLSVNTGTLSNNGGTIATNGALDLHANAVSNRGGTLAAQTGAALTLASLDNSAGGYVGAKTVSVTDAGALDNTGGTIQANDTLAVSAAAIANDGGSIANGGKGATTVGASSAITNTRNGLIGGNGNVTVSGGSVGNAGGTITAGGLANVTSGGLLDNRTGMIQGTGATITAQGAIDTTGGQIESDGAGSALAITAASVDNTDGRIANTGAGATTVTAGSVTNRNAGGVAGVGTIGGNGDVTINAQTLSSTNGAQVLSGHDLMLNIGQLADNTNATLSGANNLSLNGPNAALVNVGGSIHGNGAMALNIASLDNTGGRIGNDTGSGGSIAINAQALGNQSGAIGSDQNLSITTGTLTGDGSIIAGNDGAVAINGNYTLDGVNRIQANNNLTFTTSGAFTNQGTLGAVNALTVNAASVDNQAGADINSSNTTVNASGTISNAGRIEGDDVTTHSASLANVGTIVGNNVTLNAGSITNTGAAAVIAGASSVNLFGADISNTGSANIFSLGDINIAANATRDANGHLANRAHSVTNDQSTIDAQGNIEIATQTLTNTRPAPTVATVTTDAETVHQTKRDKYMACTPTGGDKGFCTQQMWSNGYKDPLNATFNAADVVSTASGPNAVDKVLVVNINGQPTTIYYNSITPNANGTITVNYWDSYDPHVNFDPGSEYPGDNQAHHGYQRVEVARDTTTTTRQDQVTGSQAQQAQIMSGGNMVLANVGTINNAFSAIGAGNAIQIGSAQANGDVASGNYGGTLVNNTGQTLYQYQQQDIVSTYAWNEDISRDRGTVVQPTVIVTPVAIGGLGGTIIANDAVQINATDINNTNVAAANSATGATGGTLGANGTVGGVTGGGAQTVNLATGQTQTINAPQSVAGATGSLNITLPKSGLYTYNTAPGATYLIATDSRLTSYANFISSDYMLGQLGLDPSKTIKRLGDGVYEEQLIRNQVTQLTGRVYLQGYTSNEDEYRALMDNGVNVAKAFNLEPGMALTAAQMDALTSDIVWLVSQTVTLPDGSTQTVLAPVVYLAHTHANDLQPTGALISADDVEIHATGSAVNSGVIKGGTQTVISATNIVNRGGAIGSSGTNGTTVVSATNDVVNASGQITGNRVAVLAGHDIVNTTLVDTVGVTLKAGSSVVSQTLLGAQGTIASTGDMVIAAGHDLTVHGANISAGGGAQITAGHDVNVDAVQSDTSQAVTTGANRYAKSSTTINETSGVSAGDSLAMQSGNDMTFKGASVSAGSDMAVVAGGNLTATTVTNTASRDDVYLGDKTRSTQSHSYDEQAVGTSFSAGGNATLAAVSSDAGKGNVTLTGSSLSTDTGAANIAATGNVTINEAREEHDSYSQTQSKRGSFVHGSTTDEMQASQANVGVASTVSGNTVSIGAGKDLTVQGSNVVGTSDVKLAAAGNVSITAAHNTEQYSGYYDHKESGISGSGGFGVSIGSSEQKDQYNGNTVTQSQSRSTVGSVEGNVSIAAGKNLHIGGSDIVAGSASGDTSGKAGNIAIRAQNITVDPGQDTAQDHDRQESKSSGVTLAVTGTLYDTARNLKSAASLGNAYQRAQGIGNELGASAADTPSVTATFSHSSSSTTTDVASVTNAGSTIRGAGNVTLTATGGAARSANGNAVDGDITVTGSTIMAGATTTLDANRNVTLQASTDQLQQSSQSNHSATTFQVASASLGDLGRWISGGPNSSGISSSPYNTSKDGTNAIGSNTSQTSSVVSGNNVVVTSHTGDVNVIGSGIAGTQGVDIVASLGSINVMAGVDTVTNHLDNSHHQFGDTGSNGTGTGFSNGVANSHSTQDSAGQTQSTMRSQIVSGDGNVTLIAKQDVNVQGSDLAAASDLTIVGKNINLDAGTDAAQSHTTQSASQYGVTLALGGVAGDSVATVNRSMTAASQTHDSRLAALDIAQAGLAAYGAQKAAASGKAPALIKATVSVGGGSSHSESQSSSVEQSGSTLTGNNVALIAMGSGAKDAAGVALDGDINSQGAKISGQNVVLDAARDVNLTSAQDMYHESSSNSSSNASVGIGAGLGGTQNGFTLELAASGSKGHTNGNGVTNHDTQISASNSVSVTSGRDTTLAGAEVAGNRVDMNVGRDLTITSRQDTNAYDSRQSSAGIQASICVPPFCVGQTVSGSASVSDQKINSNYQSVSAQSGIYAGSGGFDVNVGNHTQINGGAIVSEATADRNTLSTQTFGFTDLQNHADYSATSVGFSGSTASGKGAPAGIGIPSMGPTGFGAAGTSDSASGTTYAVVSPGTITVRGDAGTGHDSTAGLSRDAANANGSVADGFNASKVQDDLAIQQAAVQVGMQVAGDVADALAKSDPGRWGSDGEGRMALHVAVAAAGAAMGGGNVAGAIGGTIAGDLASSAVGNATGNALAGNIAAGVAGAVAGGVAGGGAAGAVSGANGALGADMYNRQLHPDEKKAISEKANGDKAEEKRLTQAACYAVQCWAQYSPNSDAYAANYVSAEQAAQLGPEMQWVQSQTVPGGLFDYTPVQRLTDKVLSQGDMAVRGAQNIANDIVRTIVNRGQTSPADADPLTDAMNGGKPPSGTAGAVVTPALAGIVAAACADGNLGVCGAMGVAAGVAVPGFGPGNATFNSRDNGSSESTTPSRPGWRQSENDVGLDLGPSYDPQTSYKNGQKVPNGTAGSVRPDFVAQDGSLSFEVKNYNINSNSSGLINNVAQQAIQRQANLPDGMQQQIVIDVRGQTITPQQEIAIRQGIVSKSNGVISSNAIQFKR